MIINGLNVRVLEFFKQVKIETKKVFWPSRSEVLVSVFIVMIMLSISALFFLVVDHCIGWVMHAILDVGS
ncbi:MAG: preprotein translocase subunit SecE [Candidatus Liberibacter europaeus]|uniref:Protein translocase subunit SecE n=1 Tax=Candidatus Liberibacter europaeus TaxID=744859 RepID=A0A2T4VY80_9HYPH|nr:preprotein translocase subunit SecE [Candidatus Liberibacter europaeus]PTL86724.1 MAG: preprotein translocase subunit SecE [Candidatus Liberibacter europaeus]